MGFKKRIRRKILLEWENFYISYKTLQLFFKPFKTTAKLLLVYYKTQHNDRNDDFSLSYEEKCQLQGFYYRFKEILLNEIEKVNSFLTLQVKICETEWNLLKSRTFICKQDPIESERISELEHLKGIFHQFYLKLGYINEYFKTNEFIISHIQVKFNTLALIFNDFLDSELINPKQSTVISQDHCQMKLKTPKEFHKLSTNSLKKLHKIIDKARFLYLNLYYHGFARSLGYKVLKELFRQTQSKPLPTKNLYAIYFYLGIALILLIMIALLIYHGGLDPDSDDQAKISFKYQFPIFRGFLFILLYLALLTWNVYGWMKNHVNYRAIFGFFSHYSSASEILYRILLFWSGWLLTYFIYLVYLTNFGSDSNFLSIIPINYMGGINWVIFLGYLFFPHKKYLNGPGRGYIFRMFWKILSRSWIKVEFPMIFIINQFTSFVLALKDLEYTVCFYISIWLNPDDEYPKVCMNDSFQIGFLVAFLPLLIRIIQCCRVAYDRRDPKLKRFDLINIEKFMTSAVVTILSLLVGFLRSKQSHAFEPIFTLWVITASISTVYSYLWDIKMGWGLCEKGYGLLRAKMHYARWIYYTAIVLNLIFRITWILNISPDVIKTVLWRPELSSFLLGFFEMMRRTIWNFLRVDKESVYNPGQYKFIPDIVTSLNEISVRSSLDKIRKSGGRVSLESKSSFNVDDLLKKEQMNSLEDLITLKVNGKTGNSIDEEDEGEEWELVEERNKKESKIHKEELEEMKKAIESYEKNIIAKSRNHTLIEIDGKKEF